MDPHLKNTLSDALSSGFIAGATWVHKTADKVDTRDERTLNAKAEEFAKKSILLLQAVSALVELIPDDQKKDLLLKIENMTGKRTEDFDA